MEQELQLKLPDGKILYYVHTKAEASNRKAIVHIHGLASDPYGVPQTLMAQQFPTLGYDVVRPYLYHWATGARLLHETTIAVSAADIEALIDELEKSYDQIFVCGHSYGGPMTMSLRQERLAAVSLWDPTYVPQYVKSDPNWSTQIGDLLISKGPYWFIVGKDYDGERDIWTLDYSRALAATWQKPVQVIHAGDGLWVKYESGESFHSTAQGQTDYRVIDGTMHCFVERDTTQQLLAAVKDWFDKY